MAIYLIPNGPMPTTSAFPTVQTGTSRKTMLQIKPSATIGCSVLEVVISFNGTTANVPVKVEFVETDVAATVTASVANDIMKLDADALMGGDPTTNLIQVGTTSTGYTSSGEGSITASRYLAAPIFVSPTGSHTQQFPLGEQGFIQPGKFFRVIVTAPNDVGCMCAAKIKI